MPAGPVRRDAARRGGRTVPGDDVGRPAVRRSATAYRAIVVENVVEAATWVMFPAWLHAMDCLGYHHQLVSLNSMHAQAMAAPRAPQSRDRHLCRVLAPAASPRRTSRRARSPGARTAATSVAAIQAWKNRRTVGPLPPAVRLPCADSAAAQLVEPYALPGRGRDRLDPCPGSASATAPSRCRPRRWPASRPGCASTARAVRHHPPRSQPATSRTIGAAPRVRHRRRLRQPPRPGRAGRRPRRQGSRSPPSEPMRTMTTRAETALVVPVLQRGHAPPRRRAVGHRDHRDRYALVVPSGGTWNDDPLPSRRPVPHAHHRRVRRHRVHRELKGGGSHGRECRASHSRP